MIKKPLVIGPNGRYEELNYPADTLDPVAVFGSIRQLETPSGAINGSNTIFTIAQEAASGSEHVYLNGLLITTYTLVGTTLTLTSAPLIGDTLLIDYWLTLPTTAIVREVPAGVINGSNTIFNTANDMYAERVWKNGLLQHNYTVTPVNQINFITAPISGDTLLVSYRTTNAMHSVFHEIPVGSGTDYTLKASPWGRTLHIYKNGLLTPGFTLVDNEIVFDSAPLGGDTLRAYYDLFGCFTALGESVTGAIDGSNTVFVLPVVPGTLRAHHNGLAKVEGVHYTKISNRMYLTFTPISGDYLTVDWSV